MSDPFSGKFFEGFSQDDILTADDLVEPGHYFVYRHNPEKRDCEDELWEIHYVGVADDDAVDESGECTEQFGICSIDIDGTEVMEDIDPFDRFIGPLEDFTPTLVPKFEQKSNVPELTKLAGQGCVLTTPSLTRIR